MFAGNAVVGVFTPALFPLVETKDELDARSDNSNADYVILAVLTGAPFFFSQELAAVDGDTNLRFLVGAVVLNENT